MKMTKRSVRLSKQKSNRSRTNRAKKIKESWIKRKANQRVDSTDNRSAMVINQTGNDKIETVSSNSHQTKPEEEVVISTARETSGSSDRNQIMSSPIALQDMETYWDSGKESKTDIPIITPEQNDFHLDTAWGSNAEFDEIMAEELTTEQEPRSPSSISGNRIVEIGYLLQRTIQLAEDHARRCTSGRLHIEKENRSGLIGTIVYKCNLCEKTISCSTEDPHKPKSTINTAAVWGTFATGSTYKHTEEFLSCLDIPPLSNTMYYAIQSDLSNVWMESLYSNMEKAGKEERALAIEKGQVDKDGTPWICVYLDGGWSKRSYGHNYNAASGVGVIIGRETKKVLYLGVRNKFCIICARAQNKDNDPTSHTCFKNWTGSSTAMEADIIVEGFRRSMEMHGVKYKQFIADGDSSVYVQIQQKVPYGKEVVKKECTNHVIKNYGKRLYIVKNDTKNVPFAARKLLTYKKILDLQKIAQKAIYDNAHGDIPTLKRDLENGPYHVFEHHIDCAEYYCSTSGNTDSSQLNVARSTGLFRLIQGALSGVIRKGALLIDNETNNRAEIFMSILARFNMGKRLNLTQRSSFQSRSRLTGLRYNEGYLWHTNPWKKAVKQSPGKYFKKFMTSQQKYKRKLHFGSTPKQKSKTIHQKKSCNTEYGPLALENELTAEELAEECNRKLETLQVTQEMCNEISKTTVGQFDNPRYRVERCERLTASNFGTVIKRRDHTPCHSLVKSVLTPQNFTSEAVEYGKMKEVIAVSLVEEVLGVSVEQSGLFIDVENSFLGASPDGLIGTDAIVEVKCLFKVAKSGISLEEAAKTIPTLCLGYKNNKLYLKKSHNYYYQVQGQLNISKRKLCYFTVFVKENMPLYIEEIERDELFWQQEMLPKLTRFYKQCILPELVRGNLRRGLMCIDPDYIIEAQQKKKKSKQYQGV